MAKRTKTKLRMLPGINIQFPVVDWIVSGQKTVETRKYPIPKKFIGEELVIIETPGKQGKFKARIAGIVVFGDSFQYKTKSDFYADSARHMVTPELKQFSWEATKGIKFGWPVLKVRKIGSELPKGFKKGIVFAKDVPIEI